MHIVRGRVVLVLLINVCMYVYNKHQINIQTVGKQYLLSEVAEIINM